MAFDLRCHDLALHFLPHDVPNAVADELAQLIQDTIEGHLNYGSVTGAQPPPVAGEDSRPRPDSEVSTDERFLRVVK